jgi:hypothetical protein
MAYLYYGGPEPLFPCVFPPGAYEDPGATDTIGIARDDPVVEVGDTFSIAVHVFNDEGLAGVHPGYISYDDDRVRCDSVTYQGTRLETSPPLPNRSLGLLDGQFHLSLGIDVLSDTLNPGAGAVADIWFTALSEGTSSLNTQAPDAPYVEIPDLSGGVSSFCALPEMDLGTITIVKPLLCGDANASGAVDIDDIVYLIAFIFSGGPPPDPMEAGDVNLSGGVDIDDVVYLINYVFAEGPRPCAPHIDDPRAHWSFDEGSGSTAHDYSGHGFDGYVDGASWVDGISYSALEFSGSDEVEWISHTLDNTVDDGFTIMVWLNWYGSGLQAYIFDCRNRSVDGGFVFYLTSDGRPVLRLWHTSGSQQVVSDSSISIDTWTHVAGVFDALEQKLRLYINGQASDSAAAESPYRDNNDEGPAIGNNLFYGDDRPFNGIIDEVRFYDAVLHSEEISAYCQGFDRGTR